MFESILTQMLFECGNEVVMKNVFESVLTQMKLYCRDEKLKKNKFDWGSTQIMMMCGEGMCFHVKDSMNVLLKKFTHVNVLQLVINNYLEQKLPSKPGGYDVTSIRVMMKNMKAWEGAAITGQFGEFTVCYSFV